MSINLMAAKLMIIDLVLLSSYSFETAACAARAQFHLTPEEYDLLRRDIKSDVCAPPKS